MAKYRGKYKKSRMCLHAIEVMMVMVFVKDSCPMKVQFSSGPMVEKFTCEECTEFKQGPKFL